MTERKYHDLDSKRIGEYYSDGLTVQVNQYFNSGKFFLTYEDEYYYGETDAYALRVPNWVDPEFAQSEQAWVMARTAEVYLFNNWPALVTACRGLPTESLPASPETCFASTCGPASPVDRTDPQSTDLWKA